MATSEIAYVEVRAALARRRYQGNVGEDAYRSTLAQLQTDWDGLYRVAADRLIITQAAELAERYRLRACDAMHLASSLELHRKPNPVVFGCWDAALNAAAGNAGLKTIGPA